jgi:hypothetical protein
LHISVLASFFLLSLTSLVVVSLSYVVPAQNLAIELTIEQTGTAGSRNFCLRHDSDDAHLSVAAPSIERLVSGLKGYALSHGNTCEKCDACCMNR